MLSRYLRFLAPENSEQIEASRVAVVTLERYVKEYQVRTYVLKRDHHGVGAPLSFDRAVERRQRSGE